LTATAPADKLFDYGVIAARSICRILIFDRPGHRCGYASGFLIAPNVLITNHHVLPDADFAANSIAQFDYELDVFGRTRFRLNSVCRRTGCSLPSEQLDFTIVAVLDDAAGGGASSAKFGYLPLIGSPGKALEGEWLTIIQHPGAERKQLCARENRLLTRTDEVLWYTTDTLGGTSGSPVFNNDWQVVALHHKGVPEERNGSIRRSTDEIMIPAAIGKPT
jgi:endonuclease G